MDARATAAVNEATVQALRALQGALTQPSHGQPQQAQHHDQQQQHHHHHHHVHLYHHYPQQEPSQPYADVARRHKRPSRQGEEEDDDDTSSSSGSSSSATILVPVGTACPLRVAFTAGARMIGQLHQTGRLHQGRAMSFSGDVSFLFLMAGEECAGSEFIASIRKHARPHHASTPDDLLQRPIITDGPGSAAWAAELMSTPGAFTARFMMLKDDQGLNADVKIRCNEAMERAFIATEELQHTAMQLRTCPPPVLARFMRREDIMGVFAAMVESEFNVTEGLEARAMVKLTDRRGREVPCLCRGRIHWMKTSLVIMLAFFPTSTDDFRRLVGSSSSASPRRASKRSKSRGRWSTSPPPPTARAAGSSSSSSWARHVSAGARSPPPRSPKVGSQAVEQGVLRRVGPTLASKMQQQQQTANRAQQVQQAPGQQESVLRRVGPSAMAVLRRVGPSTMARLEGQQQQQEKQAAHQYTSNQTLGSTSSEASQSEEQSEAPAIISDDENGGVWGEHDLDFLDYEEEVHGSAAADAIAASGLGVGGL